MLLDLQNLPFMFLYLLWTNTSILVGNHRWNKAQTWSDAPRTPDVLLFQRPTSHYPKGSSCPAVSWLPPWIACPLPLPPGSPSAPYPTPPLALHPSSLMWWWSPGPASAGSLPHDVRMLKPLFCLSQYTTGCPLVSCLDAYICLILTVLQHHRTYCLFPELYKLIELKLLGIDC